MSHHIYFGGSPRISMESSDHFLRTVLAFIAERTKDDPEFDVFRPEVPEWWEEDLGEYRRPESLSFEGHLKLSSLLIQMHQEFVVNPPPEHGLAFGWKLQLMVTRAYHCERLAQFFGAISNGPGPTSGNTWRGFHHNVVRVLGDNRKWPSGPFLLIHLEETHQEIVKYLVPRIPADSPLHMLLSVQEPIVELRTCDLELCVSLLQELLERAEEATAAWRVYWRDLFKEDLRRDMGYLNAELVRRAAGGEKLG